VGKLDPAIYRFDTSKILVGFFAVIVVIILAQFWWSVEQDKQQTLAAERVNGLVASRILEEHAAQTLQDGVQKLDNVALAIVAMKQNDASIPQILKNYDLQDSRFIKALQYVDLGGVSWVFSPDYPAHQADVKDRKYVQFLLKHPEHTQPVIGHPYQSSYDSQLVLPLARNVYNQDNQPIGIISTDIRLSYFANVYARVAQQSNAMVSLIADEGFVIVRSPFEARYVDRDISNSTVIQHLPHMPVEGYFEDANLLDDEFARLYTYRKISGFPLTVIYGRDFDSILTYWTSRMERRLVFTISVLMLFCLMSWILRSHVKKLRQSEISLRNSEFKFSEIFQRSPAPLSIMDFELKRVEAVNDAMLTLIGYSKDEAMGLLRNYKEKLWVDDARRREFVALLLTEHQVDGFEALVRRGDGKIISSLFSARLYDTGPDSKSMYILSQLDVTRQREVEQQIRELNAELEQRVSSRTHKLELSNAELADALTSLKKIQFELIRSEKLASLGSLVAGIAHELNTPIGNAVTIASTIQDESKRLQAEVQGGQLRRTSFEHFLSQISYGSDVLLRSLTRAADLIRSFKNVAVDQTSDMRRQFDLSQMLEEIVLTNAPLYRKAGFVIENELEPGIVMDGFPGALGQVVTNLIGNSVTHGFDGRSHGKMKMITKRATEGTVMLSFEDDGIGITEADLKKVFDPFFTTKLGQGGSGLGMNIVYNLVTEVLGGDISVTSNFGHGTCITMVFPLLAPKSSMVIN
jgi:PAS domain S-box-containing protein